VSAVSPVNCGAVRGVLTALLFVLCIAQVDVPC
jgi:hypothetical protein